MLSNFAKNSFYITFANFSTFQNFPFFFKKTQLFKLKTQFLYVFEKPYFF